MDWLAVGVCTALLVAGIPRLRGPAPGRRWLGIAAVAAALTTMTGIPTVHEVVVPAVLSRNGLIVLQHLGVTLGATALLSVTRRLAVTGGFLSTSPVAYGLLVAVLQVCLIASNPDPLLAVGTPEGAGLWIVTIGWAVVGCGQLLSQLSLWAAAADNPLKCQAHTLAAGILVLLLGGLAQATHLVLDAVSTLPGGQGQLDATITRGILLGGLAITACGLLLARVVTTARPLVRWVHTVVALRRLSRLATALASATPEWVRELPPARWNQTDFRHPDRRLYQVVIFIRDATVTLLGAVDNELIRAAVGFALHRRPHARPASLEALAEACWLRYAADTRAAGGTTPPYDRDMQILDADPGPTGSLGDEVIFLTAVAAAWDGPLVEQFIHDSRSRSAGGATAWESGPRPS